MLENIGDADTNLIMETDAGSKRIHKKVNTPAFGQIWHYPTVVSNLCYLLDIICRGHQLFYDSEKTNVFLVCVKNQNIVRYAINEQGVYVKKDIMNLEGNNVPEDEEYDDEEDITLLVKY